MSRPLHLSRPTGRSVSVVLVLLLGAGGGSGAGGVPVARGLALPWLMA